LKRLTTEWEKIFASNIFDKGLVTRINRELKNLNSPQINVPRKTWADELNRAFLKEEVQMAGKTHEEMLNIHKGNSNQNHV
jgi:hypothetical protein